MTKPLSHLYFLRAGFDAGVGTALLDAGAKNPPTDAEMDRLWWQFQSTLQDVIGTAALPLLLDEAEGTH